MGTIRIIGHDGAWRSKEFFFPEGRIPLPLTPLTGKIALPSAVITDLIGHPLQTEKWNLTKNLKIDNKLLFDPLVVLWYLPHIHLMWLSQP